jgi:hypothetical protein
MYLIGYFQKYVYFAPMKFLFLSLLSLAFLTGCHQNNSTSDEQSNPAVNKDSTIQTANNDNVELVILLKEIFKWHDKNQSSLPDFIDSANFSTEKKKDSLNRFVAKKAVFHNNEPFQIVHSARGITDQSSAKDTRDCKGWTITNKALTKIIKDSRTISGTEWDLSFSVLPCIVKGELVQNGNGFDFEVNGGSWFYLKSADTTLIFGNFKKEDEKYFLVKPAKE